MVLWSIYVWTSDYRFITSSLKGSQNLGNGLLVNVAKKKKHALKETRVHQRNTRAREQTREIELPSKEIEKKGFALVCISLNFSCVPVKIPRSCMSV